MKLETRFTTVCLAVLALLAGAVAVPAATPLTAVVSVDNAAGPNDGSVVRVRVAHLSPDAPNVDVLVDDAVAFGNIPYGDVTDYLGVPGGTYNVKVVPAGATEPVVFEADLALAAGDDITVIASDVLANFTPVLGADDNSAPPAGDARVRFFHGSPDAPNVDIAVTDGPVLFADVPFGSFGDYLSVPAGAYDLEVRVAGTPNVVLTLPGTTLEAGTVYTVYAAGLVADGFADRTLYLGADDRFRLEVTWTDFEGGEGFGRQVGLSNDTGYFWFFDDTNVELVTKVLDARAVNGNYWVFFGSLTNVGFTLTVTDTVTGTTNTYTNPLGVFASEGDTGAFPGT